MRSRFSVITPKKVLTLVFDRSVDDDPKLAQFLFEKLEHTRSSHGVIVCTAETVKSLMLKFVELFHVLEGMPNPMSLPSQLQQELRKKVKKKNLIKNIFQNK